MKQKYTLNIADLQISVVTDATPAEVERISGILDRRMREIYLKSRCPKTEAALLCALGAVAERISQQEEIASLEERCDKYAVVLENIKERYGEQSTELERLRNENAVLRSLIANAETAPVAPDPISPAEFFSQVADAQTQPAAPKEIPAPIVPEATAAPQAGTAPTEDPVRKNRSRVGAMFDLLSFGEAD